MKLLLLLVPFLAVSARAADLILWSDGTSDHQIVLPDRLPAEGVDAGLVQTARLLQTAFQANGVAVPVVREGERDSAKPGLYLGATEFCRLQGIDPASLREWSYRHRVVGRDVLLVGHDHPARGEVENSRRPNWDRVGTAKAAVDFARAYLGVRFLYPEIGPYHPVGAAGKIDLLASPALEFLPVATAVVPADLDLVKTPWLRLNTAHPAGGGFYDLAHDRFPRVDEVFGGHTWERAVPPERYADSHPEYFALVSGERLLPEGGNAQYCLSNPEVRELIYRDLASWLDRGYGSVDLGQPDGFRECQCDQCAALYDTGTDWGEKIWRFNREVAERLLASHPDGQVTMMSYILTAVPPKGFTRFPDNTSIMLTGTNEEDIAPWRGHEVPRGFTGYIYNWCPNLGTRYTPMRTPGHVEEQIKRLAANRIQSLYRDGPGQLFGLEGPVYYTMGRMCDDPEGNAAKDLLPEFVEAAFGKSSWYMRSFYDQLYHAITLYSDHLGTRGPVWTYQPVEGRRRKTVTDPFQLLAFLYPPGLLASLESDLAQAERLAGTGKVRTRLALVRTEFDYLKHLARVVHLFHAYQVEPDAASRDRLLDAIDARNAFIDSLYDERGNGKAAGGWSHVLFPYAGHNAAHLRLAHDGYQEPYANTCFNWDTKAMRNAPVPGRKRLSVPRTEGPVRIGDPRWESWPGHALTQVPSQQRLPRRTTFVLVHDGDSLFLRARCDLDPGAPAEFPAQPQDRSLANQEALDLHLAPVPGREISYRFMAGPHPDSRYDALCGEVADAMDPRFGKEDPAWNGAWTSETRVDATGGFWEVLVTIPFATLGVDAPSPGQVWKGNVGRNRVLPRAQVDRSVWSTAVGGFSLDDRSLFGEIVFE